MSIMNRIFNSVIFRRILVIFVVGLVSRGIINYVYDVNVFKEYTGYISLIYYGFMVCFTGFVYELPSISFKVLNISVIRSAVRVFLDGNFLGRDKMGIVGDNSSSKHFVKNHSINTDKDSLVCKQDEITQDKNLRDKSLSREREERVNKFGVRRPSAGVRALYDPKVLRSEDVVSKGDKGNSNLSFEKRFKCRFV